MGEHKLPREAVPDGLYVSEVKQGCLVAPKPERASRRDDSGIPVRCALIRLLTQRAIGGIPLFSQIHGAVEVRNDSWTSAVISALNHKAHHAGLFQNQSTSAARAIWGGNNQTNFLDQNPSAFDIGERIGALFGGVSRNPRFCGLDSGLLYQAVCLPPGAFHLTKLALHDAALPFHFKMLTHHGDALPSHLYGLAAVDQPSEDHDHQLKDSDASEHPCKYLYPPLYLYVLCLGVSVGLVSVGGWLAGGRRGLWVRLGWFLGAIGVFSGGCVLSTLAFGTPFFLWTLQWLEGKGHSDNCSGDYHGTIVLQKYLDKLYSCSTVIDMANVLSKDKQIAVVSALAEGSSIRSIERMTGVNRNTIMTLGVRVGKGCTALLDAKMRDLPCRYLQFDEVWGFIGKKERHVRPDDDPQYGDVWTFCAIDADTKLVPSFKCGKRNLATAKVFVDDVASRMRTRVQISSDALRAYVDAIEQVYGADVDYGQVVKNYEHDDAQNAERKYSAARFVSVEKRSVTGSPDMDLVSTSYIERLNATTRLHMRRLTRLTLAFSKKFENFEAAVGLHFAYYNLVKRHGSLRMTPAMAAGIERDFWSVADLVEAAA